MLDVGPARQDTVDFFSRYRCRLHVADLFSELPIEAGEEGSAALQTRFEELLRFPQGTVFDICLFWDLFNYLGRDAILAFVAALRPYLRRTTMAHGFALHNLNARREEHIYAVNDVDAISATPRLEPLPGYAPHPQARLKNMLYCFGFERSVLLADGRLELLMRAKP